MLESLKHHAQIVVPAPLRTSPSSDAVSKPFTSDFGRAVSLGRVWRRRAHCKVDCSSKTAGLIRRVDGAILDSHSIADGSRRVPAPKRHSTAWCFFENERRGDRLVQETSCLHRGTIGKPLIEPPARTSIGNRCVLRGWSGSASGSFFRGYRPARELVYPEFTDALQIRH